MDISSFSQTRTSSDVLQISPGDTVKVSYRVREANRERVQTLTGLVVRIRKGGGGGSFTIRRVTYGVGVEHTFPFASPFLEKVEVVRHAKVRRAKLYYIRRLSAREARLKERREKVVEKLAVAEGVGAGERGDEAVAGEIAEEVVAEETEKVE